MFMLLLLCWIASFYNNSTTNEQQILLFLTSYIFSWEFLDLCKSPLPHQMSQLIWNWLFCSRQECMYDKIQVPRNKVMYMFCFFKLNYKFGMFLCIDYSQSVYLAQAHTSLIVLVFSFSCCNTTLWQSVIIINVSVLFSQNIPSSGSTIPFKTLEIHCN